MTRKQVTHVAVEAIQDMVLKGEIAPGEKLPGQTELSRRLGISRASLREALSTLETLGFLEIQPGRGTFVSSPHPTLSGRLAGWRYDDSYRERDVFQTRLFIESMMVSLAAHSIDSEALDELRKATREMRKGWERQDLLRVTENDVRFHSMIAKACGNPMIRHIYEGLHELFHETQRHPIPITRPKRAQESAAEHDAIIDALHARDGDEASRVMQRHIIKTAAELGISLRPLPGAELAGSDPAGPDPAGDERDDRRPSPSTPSVHTNRPI